MTLATLTNRIVAGIEKDIHSRHTLGDAWDEIDEEIKKEIRAEWARIIQNELRSFI